MGAVMSASELLFSNGIAKQLVEKEIEDNSVVVFSKTYCGFCHMAKKSLTEVGANFKVIELDKVKNGYAIQQYLSGLTGESTVPRVFINGKCIGGGTETKAMRYNGKLIKLINGQS